MGEQPDRPSLEPTAAALARRGLAVLAIQVGGLAVGIAVPVVLGRSLGAAGFGTYRTVLAWIQVAAMVPALGLDGGALRFLPTYAASGRWGELRAYLAGGSALVAAATALGAAAVVAVGYALEARGMVAPATAATVRVGAVLLCALVGLAWCQALLRAFERAGRAQVLESLVRPVALIALLLLVTRGTERSLTSAEAMLWNGLVVGAVLVPAVRWIRAVRPPAATTAPARFELRAWLRAALPMQATALLQQVLRQLDVLFVGAFLGSREAGLYNAAAQLARLVVLGQGAGNTIAAPHFARLHALGRRAELARIARLTCLGATASALALAALLVGGRAVVLSVFGEEYVGAGKVLGILVAGQVVNAAAGPVGYLLNLTGHQDDLTRITFALVVVGALALRPAIAWGGMEGAAAVAAGLVAGRNLAALWMVRQRLGIDPSGLTRGT